MRSVRLHGKLRHVGATRGIVEWLNTVILVANCISRSYLGQARDGACRRLPGCPQHGTGLKGQHSRAQGRARVALGTRATKVRSPERAQHAAAGEFRPFRARMPQGLITQGDAPKALCPGLPNFGPSGLVLNNRGFLQPSTTAAPGSSPSRDCILPVRWLAADPSPSFRD